jgi:hypothetical protein
MATDSKPFTGEVIDFLSSQDNKRTQLRRVVKPKVCKPAVAFAGQMVHLQRCRLPDAPPPPFLRVCVLSKG